MHKNERVIYFADLIVSSHSSKQQGISPKPLIELVTYLDALKNTAIAKKKYDVDTQTIYLADVIVDNVRREVTLLISRSNKNAPDPVFVNPDRNTRRVITMQDDEGSGSSSHIVIKLDHKVGMPDRYLMLIEMAVGLGISRLEAYFKYLLKEVAKANPMGFLVNALDGSIDASGNPRQYKYRSEFEIRGHLSGEFWDELNKGTIEELEVFTELGYQNLWDDGGYAREEKSSVHIKVRPDNTITNSAIVRMVTRRAAPNYESARLRFKTRENSNREVFLNADSLDLARDYMYVKRQIINGFNPPLISAYDTIYEPIVSKIKTLF
ncbi:hypothetical protein [Agitococcus lubricus]|uniref:Uncharacterized protein n=1 Tax=Agitococcus lubricus TaxID=1077255 RepID=A0A2T5J1E7_9GAMM|nr:hypothetical protein [Agitococcus lubricus]PTQ90264.1 hypothetical protein C8N29_10317 [Agitococcus lubricus]